MAAGGSGTPDQLQQTAVRSRHPKRHWGGETLLVDSAEGCLGSPGRGRGWVQPQGPGPWTTGSGHLAYAPAPPSSGHVEPEGHPGGSQVSSPGPAGGSQILADGPHGSARGQGAGSQAQWRAEGGSSGGGGGGGRPGVPHPGRFVIRTSGLPDPRQDSQRTPSRTGAAA